MSDSNLRHVMLDLETLGTSKNACIASIGACLFSPDAGYVPDPDNKEGADRNHCFHEVIDLEGSMNIGDIDPGTVRWWMKQSYEARETLFGDTVQRTLLGRALRLFGEWLAENGLTKENRQEWCLWANDPDFDVAIFTSAFERYKMPFPLSYRGSRSVRTMIHLSRHYDLALSPGYLVPENVLQHNALADSIYQAWLVTRILQALDACVVPLDERPVNEDFRPIGG